MKKRRILAAALALALAAGLLTGCGGGAGSSASASSSSASSSQEAEPVDLSAVTDPCLYTTGLPGDTVVATVGDYDITAAVLIYWLNTSISQTSAQLYGQDIPWDTDLGEGKGTFKQSMLHSALETAALYRLLPEIGAQEGLTVDQADLDALKASQKDMEDRLGSEELARHYYWLAMATPEMLWDLIQAGQIGTLLQEHYYGEGSEGYPSDADVMAYADDELGYYKVKHILLATIDTTTQEPLDEAAQAEKKKTAEDLLAQLRAAEDPIALFDELMNQYSEDPGLAAYPEGYDATKGQMYPEFEEASLALQVGEISDIVESESGYHIILRMPPDLDTLRNELVAEKMSDTSTGWLDDYGIETNENYDKIDPAAYWEKASALQQAVYAEVSPILEAAAGEDGSGSAAGSASGSASGSQG